MKVLAIESATSTGGVALLDNGAPVGSVNFSTRTLYSQRLLPSLEWLLERCGVAKGDIGGLAISRGPGSFTGLRIGMSAVKGLAYAWGVPVASVGTMEALALRAGWPTQGETQRVCTLLNARQGEVFAGLFDVTPDPHVTRLQASHLGGVAELAPWIDRPTLFAGDAIDLERPRLAELFGAHFLPAAPLRMLPNAEEVAYLGWKRLATHDTDNLMQLEPEYLRRSYTERK